MDIKKIIAKNLVNLRKKHNMTQNELAEKLFVTRQTVSGWENDRTQPDVEMLCKISEVLEVSVEDLIYGEKRYATDIIIETVDFIGSKQSKEIDGEEPNVNQAELDVNVKDSLSDDLPF